LPGISAGVGVAIGGEPGPGDSDSATNGPGSVAGGVGQSAAGQSGFTLVAKQCAEIQADRKTYGQTLIEVCQAFAKLKLPAPPRMQTAPPLPVSLAAPQPVQPQPVSTAGNDPTWVDYDQLFSKLINAIKAQQAEIQTDEASIAALSDEVKTLNADR